MNKKWFLAIIPGAIAFFFLFLILGLFVIKILWSWTVPDLFPGAVQQGLVAAEISWLTSFKLAIFVGMMGGIARVGHSKDSE